MSENQFVVTSTNQDECQTHHSQTDKNIVSQVINNQMFKLFLKDMVEQLFYKKCQQQRAQRQEQPKIHADSFIQQISDSLMLVAQTQANKKIKEAEKFFKELFEHKVKQLEDKFDIIVDRKMKQIDFKIQEIEARSKMQTSLLSPVKSVLKQKPLAQLSFDEQLTKRMQLKQKILNTQHSPNIRLSSNIQSASMLSDSLTDVSVQKFTEKIKHIQQTFKAQIQGINQKIIAIQNKAKADLEQSEANVKQHIDSGFQGIWNVISNLQKRMIS